MHQSTVRVRYTKPDAITDPTLLRAYNAVLSPAERARMHAFVFERDRREYLVAHALLRWTLSEVAQDSQVCPASWQLSPGPLGKPRIDEPASFRGLHFNLTHTRGLVACAVADVPVGIDAESLLRDVDPSVAQGLFSPWELAHLARTPASGRVRAFLRFWTLKESYVKAMGAGLSRRLDDFWFVLSSDQPPIICWNNPDPSELGQWVFHLDEIVSPDHVLSVAVRSPMPELLSFDVREELLIISNHHTALR